MLPLAADDQIDAANEAFAPSRADFEHAARILAAYDRATAVEAHGAVMLDGEMIDEASRKMAESIVAWGALPASLSFPGMRQSECKGASRHKQEQIAFPAGNRKNRTINIVLAPELPTR